MESLKQNIEALIFTAEQSITINEIQGALKAAYGWEVTSENIREIIAELTSRYESDDYAFELMEIAGGFRFLSKKDYYGIVNTMLQINSKKKLTTAALETLAIIAYKQPVSKPEIENIRGVNCDYSIQKLLEKELIVIQGKGDGPGKPLLYGISKNFMDHFGLKSAKDLPKLKDVVFDENEIGTPAEMIDSVENTLTHSDIPEESNETSDEQTHETDGNL
ncbi:MAG: SMC-Scp complex subunit ScpB [Bacteroidetes bacterium]|jgi:segregation and condensation protein B|nr:SMC-Scp complex subunit ScpB [Bacteroidota bacterium]